MIYLLGLIYILFCMKNHERTLTKVTIIIFVLIGIEILLNAVTNSKF